MLSIENLLSGSEFSVKLFTAQYDSAYSENDYSRFASFSFPLNSCYLYRSGRTEIQLSSNEILFEKEGTEFCVTKYDAFRSDSTFSIFLHRQLEKNNKGKQVLVQARKPETDVLIRKFLSAAPQSKLFREQLVCDLLDLLPPESFGCDQNRHHKPAGIRQTDRAKEFMHAFFRNEISLTEISSAAGISMFHFSRVFRKTTGYSPYDYLLRIRLQHAAQILRSGQSVTQAAFGTGFGSLEHFSAAFTAFSGCNPSAYKKSKMS